MNKSITSLSAGKPVKPPKPREDYPLFAHDSGRWAKKIGGKFWYFGYWLKSEAKDGGAQAAEEMYLLDRQAILLGLPRPSQVGQLADNVLTIKKMANDFLNAKKDLLASDEITHRTQYDYIKTCERIARVFGSGRAVDSLRPEDFAKLRADILKTLGPVATGNEINRARMVFKFAGWTESKAREAYGQAFNKPSEATLEKNKAKTKLKHGDRMFEADELRTLIAASSQPMKAMILMGINCAFGQTDLATIPKNAIDLQKGWIDFPRVKTGVNRKVPLWSETVEAIREAIATRPRPKDPSHDDLVFITKYGNPWVKISLNEDENGNMLATPADALGEEFSKLLTNQNMKRKGLGFYALRHTFQTIADECTDFVAVSSIMGHKDKSMAGRYRERINPARLQAVVDCVRAWLFPVAEKAVANG